MSKMNVRYAMYGQYTKYPTQYGVVRSFNSNLTAMTIPNCAFAALFLLISSFRLLFFFLFQLFFFFYFVMLFFLLSCLWADVPLQNVMSADKRALKQNVQHNFFSFSIFFILLAGRDCLQDVNLFVCVFGLCQCKT